MKTAVPRSLVETDPENALRFLGHAEHSHHFAHLVYVAVGAAHLEVAGTSVTLRQHEALWLAPHVPHAARYEPGSLVLGPTLSPGTYPPEGIRRLPALGELTAVMTAILGVAPQTAEQVQVFRSMLDDVLLPLLKPLFPLTAPRHPVAAAIARACVSDDAPLTELAGARGVSARHVQRLFVDETGLAFRRWRVRARLNIAAQRLHGGSTVSSAAVAAGYDTASGLRKALRREAGIEIGDLRRRPQAG
ncbi:AraC family transcriptional regulator [Gordonia iterans]|uniref:AraC family transcriptional regulator n=1 Tax=Gordonia iterans TaxID=1004901 RepID=A0A2S0KHL1_9ACTN|nr:helix-turn-helix transcriptional regulator [Gordonia iterans]AVM01121.1 AraC family transcriptional regulator [Gordonia iterans]